MSKKIMGWFTFPRLYRDMVGQVPSGGTIVEIGLYRGRSFEFLVNEVVKSKKDIRVVGIDNFSTLMGWPTDIGIREDFFDNMKEFEGKFDVIVADSTKAAAYFDERSIDFVFVDGCHYYDTVKRDIEAWNRKIKPGGFFAGHDYTEPYILDVIKAVDEAYGKYVDKSYVDEECWLVRF